MINNCSVNEYLVNIGDSGCCMCEHASLVGFRHRKGRNDMGVKDNAANTFLADNRHRQEKDWKNSAEFLSGFRKGDRLTPVVTITVYWGSDIWDGPRSLHDMLEKDEPFSDIAKYVADYKLNLIAPSEIESFDQFHTSVREVLEILKYAGDETGMDHLLHTNPSYQKLENEAVYVINQFVNLGLSVDETEGETNMCKAWDDHKKAGIREGRKEGIREGEERGRKGILISLCRSGEISVEVAAREMNISTEKFREYLV